MPELPEVETVRRGLMELVCGAVVEDIDVLYDGIVTGRISEFCSRLRGRKLTGIDRRGKYLLFRFSGSLTMVSHLRMEGKYFVKKREEPVERHTHVIFHLTDGRDLRYNDVRKFGRMELFRTGDELRLSGIAKLGPEPVEADFDRDEFFNALRKRKTAVKTALLDQTLVAGLGNIYVDEVLYQAGIHPLTPCLRITRGESDVLRDAIIAELDRAVRAGGTTIRSYANAFQKEGTFQFSLDVYGRTGEKCRRCGTPVEKIKVAGRGTHFCPQCQVMRG